MPEPVSELENIDSLLCLIRAEGVPEGVRRRRLRNPCLLPIGLDEQLDGSLREGLAIPVQEELRGGSFRTNRKVGLQSLHPFFL